MRPESNGVVQQQPPFCPFRRFRVPGLALAQALGDMAANAQSLKVRRVPGVAAVDDRPHVVNLQPPGLAAAPAAPAVPVLDPPAESVPARQMVDRTHAATPRYRPPGRGFHLDSAPAANTRAAATSSRPVDPDGSAFTSRVLP